MSVETPVRHLQAVAEFGQYALWETDLDALLREACSQVAKGLGVPYAKVLEYRPGGDDFLIRAGVGWGAGVVGSVRAPADRGHPPGLAMRTRQPVVTEDITADPRFTPTALFREYGVVALANVPIIVEAGVFGVLEVVTPRRQAFTGPEISFMQGFANLIAAVVHRKGVERSLQAALREREILLRELQHRVKNNLYVVTSLLGLQANRIDDDGARQALMEVQGRVHAIGLAYSILQASQDISRFDLGAYLGDLCRTLIAAAPCPVRLDLDLRPAQVNLQAGVPLGLIVNEIVSNSLQHAFGPEGGTVSLAVRQAGDRIELTVADDGRGMDPAAVAARHGSLGRKLIAALAVQIQGTLTRPAVERGVCYHLGFPAPNEWGPND